MKHWENPELGELKLQNTENSACSGIGFYCDKGGYKPGGDSVDNWYVCIHYINEECTYKSPGGQS